MLSTAILCKRKYRRENQKNQVLFKEGGEAMDIKELKSAYLDVEKGVLKADGQEIKNVIELSITFKDGEFGLSVTHDDNLLQSQMNPDSVGS